MASFTCHVVCVTKRLRLERLVRPPHARLAPDLATAQPLRRTVQQVWPHSLAAAEAKPSVRAAKNLHRQHARGRLRMIVLAPKLRLSEAEACHDQLPMPALRVRSAHRAG